MTLTQALDLDCIVQQDPDIIAAEADQDIVMVSIEKGFYYGVSGAAREIWDAIEQPKKVSDLINDLGKIYSVDRAVCEQQTLSFLESLLAERLLRISDGPPS